MTISTDSRFTVAALLDGDTLVGLEDPSDEASRKGSPFGSKVTAVEHGHRKALAKIVTETGTLFCRKRAVAIVTPK